MDARTRILDLILGLVPLKARQKAYALGPLTRLARRILTPGSSPDEMREVTISAGPLKGTRMRLVLSREKSLWLGTHEPEVEQALRRIVKGGGTCLDIGAHVGYFSLLLSRLVGPGGSVVAFEPHPENVARLRHHAETNRCPNIAVETMALSDRTGGSALLAKPGNDSREFHLGTRSAGGPGADVRMTTLDAWLRKRKNLKPSLLKIDVEGAEGEVLVGARRTLRRCHPIVLCEIHGGKAGRKAWEELRRAGYRIDSLEEAKPLREPPTGGHIMALPKEHTIAPR